MNPIEQFFSNEFLGNNLRSYGWFIGILLIGLLFRKLISLLFSKILFYLFHRYGKDVGFKEFLNLLSRPFQLVFILVILYLAFDQLQFPTNWNIVPKHEFGIRLVLFRLFDGGIIAACTWILMRLIDFAGLILLEKAARTETRLDDQLINFGKEGSKVVIAAIGFLIFLGVIFNLDIVSLVTGLGIGGLAFALAAKETLENLLGSFTIFLDKPFVVGDSVKVGSVEGQVESIGFRSTRIRATDKMLVTVPNKKMVDAELINETNRTIRRAKFMIGLTYSTTSTQLKAVIKELRELIAHHPMIESNLQVRFFQFGPSSLDILIVYFVRTPEYDEYLKIQEEINFRIMEIVSRNGCEFAFPSTTVYLQNEKAHPATSADPMI